MKLSEFTRQSPGEVLSIPGGVAFLAAPLPPALALTPGLLRAVESASAAIGMLLGEARQLDFGNPISDRIITGPLVARDAVDSNRIEGTQTIVEDALLQGKTGRAVDPLTRDSNREVLTYISALRSGVDAISAGQPLSPFLVRALHRELIAGTRGDERRPGEFRERQVAIGRSGQDIGSASFVPAPPEHVASAVEQMLEFATSKPELGPLVTCALLHYQFEAVHPFEDGNGRLGRLLVPLHLLAVGAIDRPVVYVSSYLESTRDTYIRRLRRVSTHGDWNEWLLFFLRAIEASCDDARTRVRLVGDLRRRYRAAASSASKSKLPILAVDVVLEHVYVTVPELAQALGGVDYKSAKGAIDALCRIGALTEMPHAHPQRWVAQELLEVAYKD